MDAINKGYEHKHWCHKHCHTNKELLPIHNKRNLLAYILLMITYIKHSVSFPPMPEGKPLPNTMFEEDLKRSNTPAATLETYKSKKEKKPFKFNKKYLKWLLYIILGVVIYFSFQYLTTGVLYLLKLNPAIWSVYQAIELEVSDSTLLGLFYAITFGALFFMPNPMEAMVIYYFGSSSFYPVQIIITALAAYMIAMSANYFLGWLFGSKFLKWLLKKRYDSFQNKMDRMGGFIIFLANLIPFFPTGPFTLFLGGVRHGYYSTMFYTILGRGLMLIIFFFGHQYFQANLAHYFETFSIPVLFESVRQSFG